MKHLLLASALLLTTAVVSAETAYIGGSVGSTTVDTWCDNVSSCSDTALTYKVFGGVRATEYFAVEVSLNDFGTVNAYGNSASLQADLTGFTLSGIGFIPITKSFEVFGKVGVVAWRSDLTLNYAGSSASVDDNDQSLLLGVGFNANITSAVGFRVEFETFDLDTDLSDKDVPITTFMVGLFYNF